MTDPYKMNCSHSPDGWCLPCVTALSAELVDAQSQVEAHQRRYHECEEFYQVRLTKAERLLKEVLGGLDCPIPMARPIAEFLRTAVSADALAERLTETERNAARYRWLRLAPQTLDACGIVGEELDAAIDKLRATGSADDSPGVIGGLPAPMPTPIEGIEAAVRLIEKICADHNLDPTEWLAEQPDSAEEGAK